MKLNLKILYLICLPHHHMRLTLRRVSGRFQPRPTKGILVAITVINSTFASSGRLAM